jgi:hypothetical protein
VTIRWITQDPLRADLYTVCSTTGAWEIEFESEVKRRAERSRASPF